MTAGAELKAKAAAAEDSHDVLERELAQLGRTLEAMQRKRNYPLDRAQYLLLRVLESQGPSSTAALADVLMLDDSTVTRQIAAMEAEGLIARAPNPKDGRSHLIRATRHGLTVAAKMRALRLKRIARLVDDWTATEQKSFAALLVKLNGNLRRSLLEA